MRIPAMNLFCPAAACLMLFCTRCLVAQGQNFGVTFTVPAGLSTVEGNNGAREPFDTGTGAAIRYQQVYFSGQFPLDPGTGGYITHLWFRVDTTVGHSFLTTLPQIQINVSTTTRPVNGLSMVF